VSDLDIRAVVSLIKQTQDTETQSSKRNLTSLEKVTLGFADYRGREGVLWYIQDITGQLMATLPPDG
jgi:hypothetical protein